MAIIDVKFPHAKTLPMSWEKCPYCGSKETFGKIGTGKEDIPGIKVTMIPLGNPAIAVTVPALLVYSDFCASCGREYTTKVEKKSVPVQAQPPPALPKR